MQSSTWRALGNTYVVVETGRRRAWTPADAVALARDADGVIEVLAVVGRPGRDRDLEPGRLARGALRQRNADRRGLARGALGRRARSRSSSAIAP